MVGMDRLVRLEWTIWNLRLERLVRTERRVWTQRMVGMDRLVWMERFERN